MEIEKDKVVAIQYRLKDDEGKVLDQSTPDKPLKYLHGHQNIIRGLEDALKGKREGDEVSVRIEPEDAYGVPRPELQQEVPRSQFPNVDEVEVGMQFQAQTKQGPVSVTVAKVEEDVVTIDANHPLAGVPLNFDVQVSEVREATKDEISHGHVH